MARHPKKRNKKSSDFPERDQSTTTSDFDPAGLRYEAAAYLRYMIRARLKDESEFMSVTDIKEWRLETFAREDARSSLQLLEMALFTLEGMDGRLLDLCPSGGMAIYEGDPLESLKQDIAVFANHTYILPNAIQTLRGGGRINWDEIADWSSLPRLREALNHLPEPTAPRPSRQDRLSKSTIPKDGPFAPDGFRWKSKVVTGLTSQQMRLITFVWSHGECPPTIQEVMNSVWDESATEVNAYRAALCLLNHKIKQLGCRAQTKNGFTRIVPIL